MLSVMQRLLRAAEARVINAAYKSQHEEVVLLAIHPKTLLEIAMVLSTNSGSFPSNFNVSATFSILLRFGELWNPTNCEKFNADICVVRTTFGIATYCKVIFLLAVGPS